MPVSVFSNMASSVLGLASGCELGQARLWWQLPSGFGPACMFEKPKPGPQAVAFQWLIFTERRLIFVHINIFFIKHSTLKQPPCMMLWHICCHQCPWCDPLCTTYDDNKDNHNSRHDAYHRDHKKPQGGVCLGPSFSCFLVHSCFPFLTSSVQVTTRIRMTKATNSKNKSHEQWWGMCPLPICFFFIFVSISFIPFLLLLKLLFTPGCYDFNIGKHTQAMETRARKPEEMAMPKTMQEPPHNTKTQQGQWAMTRGWWDGRMWGTSEQWGSK